MNQDIKQFIDLLNTDSALQEKLKTAFQNYAGDVKDEKMIYESVFLPVAKEAGFSATFEEFQAYTSQFQALEDGEDLNPEELAQVSGGKNAWGLGITICDGAGIGLGGTGKDSASACIGIGLGNSSICVSIGAKESGSARG